MAEVVGHPVEDWCGCGSVRCGSATWLRGAWRELTVDEVRALEREAVAAVA